jgi:hypothetical protein
MFDKWRKAVEANEQYQKAKAHVQRNQNTYLVGAAGIAGIAGVLVFKSRPVITIENVASPVFNNLPIFNNENIGNSVNFGGYAHKIVKCLETGEIWETVTAAAKAAGVATSKMSQHINGHMEHVDGLHYEILGVGTTGVA